MKRLINYKMFFEKLNTGNIWKIDIETIKEILYDLTDEGVTVNHREIYIDEYDNIIKPDELEIDEEYTPSIKIELLWMKSNNIDNRLIDFVIKRIEKFTHLEIVVKDYRIDASPSSRIDILIKQKDIISFDTKRAFEYYNIKSDFNEKNEPFIRWDYNELIKNVSTRIYSYNSKLLNALINGDIDVYYEYYKNYKSLISDEYLYDIINDENRKMMKEKSFNIEKAKEIYDEIYVSDLVHLNFEVDGDCLLDQIKSLKSEGLNIKKIRIDKLNNIGFEISTSIELLDHFNKYSKKYNSFEDIVLSFINDYIEIYFSPYYEDWIDIDDDYFNSELSDRLESL